jgi:hypothetical protein
MSSSPTDKLPEVPTKAEAVNAFASQVRSFAAGGFGGLCAVVVGHPFDLVKVRLQTAERGVYSSALDVVRKSVARDGLRRGLYAGVSAPLVGVTPMCRFSVPQDEGMKQKLLLVLCRVVSVSVRANHYLSLFVSGQSPFPSGATTSASKSSAACRPLAPTA